jgi:hypothetical protein
VNAVRRDAAALEAQPVPPSVGFTRTSDALGAVELVSKPVRGAGRVTSAREDEAPLRSSSSNVDLLSPGVFPAVVPPTPISPAPKASQPSTVTEDIGTKSLELKSRRPSEERGPGADDTQTAKAPFILELAAQRAPAAPAELRRQGAESPPAAAPEVGAVTSERKREGPRDEPPPANLAATPTPGPLELTPAPRAEAPPPAPPVPSMTPAMLEDPSLRVVVLPSIARVNVDTGDQGSLSLQVKVQDGVTDIRATGPAASLIEARQGELRVALANEGLALGHFDLGQSDSGGRRERFETPEERERLPRRAPPRTATTTRGDGRLSVKA